MVQLPAVFSLAHTSDTFSKHQFKRVVISPLKGRATLWTRSVFFVLMNLWKAIGWKRHQSSAPPPPHPAQDAVSEGPQFLMTCHRHKTFQLHSALCVQDTTHQLLEIGITLVSGEVLVCGLFISPGFSFPLKHDGPAGPNQSPPSSAVEPRG